VALGIDLVGHLLRGLLDLVGPRAVWGAAAYETAMRSRLRVIASSICA
jgi:hypothetical protein